MCSGKDQVASASDRSKSQEQVETIKTLSLTRHNQYSSIPDELLLLQARAMDTSDKRLRMTVQPLHPSTSDEFDFLTPGKNNRDKSFFHLPRTSRSSSPVIRPPIIVGRLTAIMSYLGLLHVVNAIPFPCPCLCPHSNSGI